MSVSVLGAAAWRPSGRCFTIKCVGGAGLGWAGLGWAGLGWAGLDWADGAAELRSAAAEIN